MTEENLSKRARHAPGSTKELLLIALPMMASSACDTVMTFTDRLFLSKIGTSDMNAALGGGMMSFLLTTFFLGLIGYSTALVGQYFGSGQKRICAVVVTQAALIVAVAYPIIILISPLARALFRASGIPSEQLALQIVYFNIMVYATIIGLLRSVLSCFFSGIGRTRTVMFASVTAMLVNVAANYVLVFGNCGFPALGIRGSAYGTITGGMCGLIVLATVYFLGNRHSEYHIRNSFKFERQIMGKLLKFGYPAGIEFFLSLGAFCAIITLFDSRGEIVATAATVTFNWDMVAYVPLVGIEIAVTSLVGRYMGARQPDTAHLAAMSGIRVGSVYSAIMPILFLSFPGTLTNIFRPDTNTAVFIKALPVTVFMVRLMSVYVLLEAVIVGLCGALRGAGDTFWAMCISVSLHWFMVVILFILFRVFNASAQTAWTAVILWFLTLSYVLYLRYRSGKWREIRVINDTDNAQEEPVGVVSSI